MSPLIQQTVGAGSPLISTSRRSLFPATTVMTFLLLAPLVSRWILGGSSRRGKPRRGYRRWDEDGGVTSQTAAFRKPFFLPCLGT